jgi:hypothetical protein
MLCRFAALVPLLSPATEAQGDSPSADLELAQLVVTDGIKGGFIGPMPRVLLAVRYDRVEHAFRAVRRRLGPDGDEAWVADLEPERFQALLELAVATGLPELPLEDPPASMDVYGRSRQVRLDYCEVRWTNGAPAGCVQGPSKVHATEEDRRRFDEVVARLEEAVDALPLRRGNDLELLRVPFVEDRRALVTYRRVMEHVLADPLRHHLDLERVSAWGNRAAFFWRGHHDGEPVGDVHFVIDGSGSVIRVPSPNEPFDRFEPPETGMTLADVLGRIGEPDQREERGDGSFVITYLWEERGARPIWPALLRFENGRLSAP